MVPQPLINVTLEDGPTWRVFGLPFGVSPKQQIKPCVVILMPAVPRRRRVYPSIPETLSSSSSS